MNMWHFDLKKINGGLSFSKHWLENFLLRRGLHQLIGGPKRKAGATLQSAGLLGSRSAQKAKYTVIRECMLSHVREPGNII